MKRYILPVCLAASLSGAAFAQQEFTLENTVPGGNDYRQYRPSSFCGYFDHTTGQFVSNDYSESKTDDINRVLAQNGKPKMGFISAWIDKNCVSVYAYESNSLYYVDLVNNTVRDSITQIMADFEYAPGDRNVSYTEEGDIYICNSQGNFTVNPRKGRGIVYGTAVHREEFGITKGIFWSQSGKKMAFYKMDESMVAEYPEVDITTRIAQEKPFRYPMAGETSHEVSVGVYDLAAKSTVYLKTASPVNRYFTNIAWSNDDKYILVAEINREQNHMWMNMYSSADGSLVKTLFEEQNNEWVEPCTPPYFVDNKQFVWISERDGFKHLYLYNIDNGKCTQLTKGNYCVTDLYGVANGNVYFRSNHKGYLYRDICKVDLKGKFTCLTKGLGVHYASFNKQLTQFIDVYTAPTMALKCTLCKSDGTEVEVLKQTENPYSDFKMPQIRLVNLKSADGKFPLSGRLILPPDFDSTKTYPVIDYVYGGPHSQMVDASWLYGASPWQLYFAQQGYIVFSMDNRGTEFRGREYEHCIHRQLGELEMLDQMEGVKYLQSLSYVDKDRIGVQGWSYGGFMTINLMTTYPEVFRAGVAGGPVCDWQYYEVMYGERYMDTPAENPEGYLNSAVVNKIGNLQGRLLVIHDNEDRTVVWQNSLALLQSSIEEGVILDYFVYPGHEHNVYGHDRVHLYQKIQRYFDDYLKK